MDFIHLKTAISVNLPVEAHVLEGLIYLSHQEDAHAYHTLPHHC